MLTRFTSKKSLIAPVLLAALMFISGVGVHAQPAPQGNVSKTELHGTRKQLATIIFSGLGGAILGLSTLSFHGRPQDNLSNIAVGFAIGIIAGTVYTTYKAATDPYEAYYSQVPEFNRLPHEPLGGHDQWELQDRWDPSAAKNTTVSLSFFKSTF